MRITELLDKRSISLTAAPASKSEALDMAVDLMAASGKIRDKEAYRKEVYLREEESTTGVGGGIAIPHGKCDAVEKPGLAAMVIKDGVDFDSLDGEPVNLIFLIAAPNTKDNIHLDVLSKLSILLMDEQFSENLKKASTPEEFLQIIDEADEEKPDVDEQLAAQTESKPQEKACRILAVTSCPTGIAHTYMAAEGIEKAAKKAGCFVKVETRGSGGAKNVLTEEEIAEADCIIVAADAEVPMDRFHGKRLIECPVSDGIGKADQLVERAMHGDVPVYKSGNPNAGKSQKSSGGGAHKVYTQLMNGVSHMLPFVVGGGILIALAFLIDGLSVDINSLSDEMRANFGTITPVAAALKGIGDTAFGFMLPVLAGFIAMSIGDRPALAVGFVGGMLASQGKSGFLGALLAGFVAGYLILLLRKVFAKLPQSIEKIAPVLLYPLFGILIMGLLMNYVIVALMLILYGVLFIVIENYNKTRKPKIHKIREIDWKTALLIGVFQLLSIVPGTSRSGATIIGGILLGTSRELAAEYTFFLAIPVMFGASLLKIVSHGFSFTGVEVAVLLVGMAVAFVVSVFAIKFLMKYIKKHDFKVFGWYRIALGVVVLLYFGVRTMLAS